MLGLPCRRLVLPGIVLALFSASGARLAAQSVITVSPRQCVWRAGDDPAWAAPNLDESGWQPYAGWKLNPEEARYWVRCQADLNALRGLEDAAIQVNVPAAYRLYVNGKLLGGAGDFRSGNFSMDVIRSFPLSESVFGSAPVTLAVSVVYRYSHAGVDITFPNRDATDTSLQIRAGSSRALAAFRAGAVLSRVRDPLIALACFGTVGVLGFVVLVLFFYDRTHRELLLFSIACVCPAFIYLAFFWSAGLVDYPIWAGLGMFAVSAIAVSLARTWSFFALARKRVPVLFWILIAISVLPHVAILPGLFLPAGGSLRLDALNVEWLVPIGVWALCATNTAPFVAFWPYGRIAPRTRPLAALAMVWGLTMLLFFSSSAAFARSIGLQALSGWLPTTTRVSAFATACVIVLLLGLLFREQRQTALERAELAGEMQAASEIQHMLAPAKIDTAPGLKIDVAFHPMREVGGDFYLCRVLPDGRQRVLVGDVSGKGAAAAMAATLLLGAAEGRHGNSPGELLEHLNRVLRRTQIGGFATCLCADLSPDGEVIVANAGHLAPYRRGEEMAVASGLPLGVADSGAGEYEESRFVLGADDALTFISDGVAEARDARGVLFGFERAAAISAQPVEEVARAAQAFGQADDITVLTLKRLGAAVKTESLAAEAAAASL